MQRTASVLVLFVILLGNLWASPVASSWYQEDDAKKVSLQVVLFLSSTCPFCEKEDLFFQKVTANNPWIHVQRHYINQDKNALILFNQLLTEQKMDDFAVPSAFFCNSRWVGFSSEESTGKDLLHAMNYCKQQIESKGGLTPLTVDVLKRWANANLFNTGMTEKPSTSHYLMVMALMDAFNPCALFCLLGFFAVLFSQKNYKNQFISGFVYIIGLGLAHYLQQTSTSTIFELMPWFRVMAILFGLYLLFFGIHYFREQRIQHTLLICVMILAFLLQLYQQTCVNNWSYVVEQWIDNQQYSYWKRGIVASGYQIFYILPLITTLFLYSIIINRSAYNDLKIKLEKIGLLIILVCAFILIIYPLLLSSLVASVIVLFVLAVGAHFFMPLNQEL